MSPFANASERTPISRRKGIVGAAAAMVAGVAMASVVAPHPAQAGDPTIARLQHRLDTLQRQIDVAKAATSKEIARGAEANAKGKCWDVLNDAKSKGFQFTGVPDRNDPCTFMKSNGLKVSSL